MRINGGEDGVVIQQLSIIIKEDVKIKLDGHEHQNVRYYVDVFTNANDSLEVSLLEYVHGLPIGLVEPTCGM
jgi:hypothetical protein